MGLTPSPTPEPTIEVMASQFRHYRESTLIASLVTADRYQRDDIINELERRANDRQRAQKRERA